MREADIRLLEQILLFQSSFLGDDKLSDEGFREVQKRCQQLLEHLSQRLMPWEKRDAKTATRNTYAELIEQYRRIFGDPNSPEFQAKQAEALAAAKRAREQQEAEEKERQERIAARRQRKSATRKSS